MNLSSLARGCAECRACEGAAYQTPPALYAGSPSAPIVAIGQNPGQIKATDEARSQWLEIFLHMNTEELYSHMPFWYQWDFYGSPGYKRLEAVLGNNWIFEGNILWTNAVRCRTKDNEQPGDAMVSTCKTWTDQLLENRKGIIMVGAVARAQIMGEEAEKLGWGIPKKHPYLGYILAIKHYAAWKTKAESEGYKAAVKKLLEAAL